MNRLPTGTVTFLFTDIEGSTRLAAEAGDEAYGTILDAERSLVITAAEDEGGVASSPGTLPARGRGQGRGVVARSGSGPGHAACGRARRRR